MENHPRFPRRVNVGVLEIVAPDHVRLRVFERGAGETRACGTGACAAVAVGRRHGPLAEEVRVDLPGGRLTVQWPGQDRQIWLTGPAETSFEGHVEIPGRA
jgi:diaminopimelate epimerase